MEIKIGIQNIAREVVVESDDVSEHIEKKLIDALANDGVFTLTDTKGRKVIVPASHIGYVDLGNENPRPVGFGAL